MASNMNHHVNCWSLGAQVSNTAKGTNTKAIMIIGLHKTLHKKSPACLCSLKKDERCLSTCSIITETIVTCIFPPINIRWNSNLRLSLVQFLKSASAAKSKCQLNEWNLKLCCFCVVQFSRHLRPCL